MRSKMMGIFLLTIFLFSIFPVAIAQEDSTDDVVAEETLTEVKTMGQRLGREVRLLQLEKSITRNILIGNIVIDVIKENGDDTTELEAFVTELEALKIEISELDPEAEDAVETFVSIKEESIEITQEFRKLAKELLGEDDKLEIAEAIKDLDKENLKNYNERIRQKVHELNAEIVLKTFESFGIEDTELIQKVENGEATHAEVREAIRNAVKNMTPEERREGWTKLKESNVKRDVAARTKIETARLRINERLEKRNEYLLKATERIQDPERRERVQTHLEERSVEIQGRIDRISERLEKARTGERQ